jgi:hypothetical protein
VNLLRTAVHESAHCVAALAVFHPVLFVTITPNATSAGRMVVGVPLAQRVAPTEAKPLLPSVRARVAVAEAFVLAVGEAVEEMIFDTAPRQYGGDLADLADLGNEVRELLGVESGLWALSLRDATRGFLTTERPRIERLAVELIRRRTLSGAEALGLIGRPPAPDLRPVCRAIEYHAARRAAVPV